jgi:hypothetical protein
MKAKHLRPTRTRRHVSRAVTVPVVALAALSMTVPAMAAKPDRSSSTSASVTCAANPSPVGWNTDYDLVTSGLGASVTVNVLVSDSVGTSSWVVTSDANGVAVLHPHANFRGTATAKVQQSVRNRWKQLTTCAFEIV